ncbi:tetratricopeptide repeat-containing sensor histidine kinase [Tenacibaculum sp. 190524A05c]|uniref:tetratricopeptide repeat-containing sensor histidine kinase n=1 Tax=Tenacibaculum platacis TaxID=3137852 RepID=UPI0032B2FA94
MKKKMYQEAEKSYMSIHKSFPFYVNIVRNLGGMALEKNQFKKAIEYFENLKTFTDSTKTLYNKTTVIHDIGISYFHLSNFEKAEKYLTQSIELQQQNKDTVFLIGSYMDLANVYYEQWKDDLAIPYFKKAYKLSLLVKDFEIKRKAALNMSVVEENRKDLSKALSYRKEHEKWKDSLNNQQDIWNVAQFEKKLAVNEKEKEIKILEAENKLKSSQREKLIISLISVLLLLFLGSYLYIQKSKSHKIISEQKKELSLLNTTKDKLFSIVSHDLRSSVNLLQKSNSKLIKNIDDKNYDQLGNIANKNVATARATYNLLENLLNWSTLQTKQLYFQIESIELNNVIQQIEFNYKPLFEDKNIIFHNKVDSPTFINADLDSLKIILRNLLDNAIKFTPVNGEISIENSISSNHSFLDIQIKDNGIGMSTDMVTDIMNESILLSKKKNQNEIGTGLGIQLCKALTAKNNAFFKIESTLKKGTTVTLSFPKTTI